MRSTSLERHVGIELGLEPRVHTLLLPGHHDFGFSGAELWPLCAACSLVKLLVLQLLVCAAKLYVG